MLSRQRTLTLILLETLLIYLIYSYYYPRFGSYRAGKYRTTLRHINLTQWQLVQQIDSVNHSKTKEVETFSFSHAIAPTFGEISSNTTVVSSNLSVLRKISTKTNKVTDKVINQVNDTNNDLIIKLKTNHGLGNLMFMYASALGIAITNGRKLKVQPFVKTMSNNFHMSSEWVNRSDPNDYPILHYPKCCKYYEETAKLQNKRFALYGFYVSWKYFHQHKNVILREFSFSERINTEKRKFLSKIKNLSGNTTLIGVHIRQGDFITSRHLGYTVASKNYIEQATDFFKNKYNCTFLIATNGNTEWINDIFSAIANIQFYFTNLKPYIDMAVLSSCDHVVTSTGTFSWWIGYFSKGTVLYYKDFPKEGSWLMNTQFENMSDYFLPEWIGL